MTPQQVQSMINQALQAENQNQLYGISSVGFHDHDGINSPVIKTPVTAYVGTVSEAGNPLTIFPKGWTSIYNSSPSPIYTITHNLNTLNYTFLAVSNDDAIAIPVNYSKQLNSVSVVFNFPDLQTVNQQDYPGSIAADGDIVFMPSGWTSAFGSGADAGYCTVTHDLGAEAYSVVANAVGLTTAICTINSVNSNEFIVLTQQLSGGAWVAADTAFNFTLTLPYTSSGSGTLNPVPTIFDFALILGQTNTIPPTYV